MAACFADLRSSLCRFTRQIEDCRIGDKMWRCSKKNIRVLEGARVGCAGVRKARWMSWHLSFIASLILTSPFRPNYIAPRDPSRHTRLLSNLDLPLSPILRGLQGFASSAYIQVPISQLRTAEVVESLFRAAEVVESLSRNLAQPKLSTSNRVHLSTTSAIAHIPSIVCEVNRPVANVLYR